MKVRFVWALAALILATSFGSADDPVPDPPEPPVRLKKKEKPAPKAPAQPAKPPAAKEKEPPSQEPREPQEPAPDPEKEAAEVLARVSKNVRATGERLSQNDAGEGTRQMQRDILKDLDSLIEQRKRRQQQQQQQQQQNASNSRERTGQQTARSQQGQKPQPSKTRQAAQGKQPQPQQQQAQKQAGMGGKDQREAMGKIADLYKEVWGHLPETLRQEMDQYAREQFMAKYSDLLKQYYATIAEKGHRKGE